MKANGHVFKYGDNVDTDVIIPARYLNSSDPKELATHCMEDIDREFVNKVNAPVTDSLMGKGAYDGTKDNYVGMLGMHGTKASNLGVSECDLLIAIGTRFSDRVLGNPKKFAKQAIYHLQTSPNHNLPKDGIMIFEI